MSVCEGGVFGAKRENGQITPFMASSAGVAYTGMATPLTPDDRGNLTTLFFGASPDPEHTTLHP